MQQQRKNCYFNFHTYIGLIAYAYILNNNTHVFQIDFRIIETFKFMSKNKKKLLILSLELKILTLL